MVQVAVLGPLEVRRDDGEPVDLGAPKPRALLAALALSPGRSVSVDGLLDLIWGDSPTPGAMSTLHAYVSGLRKVLEPGRTRRSAPEVLLTQAPGYALRVTAADVDAGRFAATVTTWHRRLAGPLLGPGPGDADAATLAEGAAALDEALALWRGEAYVELGDLPAAVAERGHLEELRLVALEDRAWARLAQGDHATVAAELEPLTALHPMRERLWALRALALVRSGRQAESLEVLRAVREVLADELGLDPGVELQDLQERILRQDPALAWRPPREAAPAAPAPPPVVPLEDGPSHAWPLLGRDREVEVLGASLARALRGRSELVVVTGAPGMGKSRLCADLLERARSRGARTVVGRCSQDDGAPPLYPWRAVLTELGGQLSGEVREGDEFRTWEELTGRVRAAAAEQPLVLVLEDLHWADTATLRALRLLVESSTDDALLVALTWRDRPEPSGALADLSDALARRHAERVHLTGLDPASVAGLVVALTDQRPSPRESEALLARTDGNPFFLVEYARLVGRGDDLTEVLRREPPTVVQDVVGRRLARLPEPTLRAVGVAAVLGRRFDLATLATTTGEDEDDVLDLLDPALATGVVREDGVDRFAFDHALVRDTLVARLPVSRRARVHARAAAALDGVAGHETELARHWLAAGPAHAAQAWRAAERAAEVSLASYGHDESADLVRQALEVLDADPTATLHDRWRLLVALAVAHRWGGRWADLTETAGRAVAVATELDDPVLLGEAGTLLFAGAHWQTGRYGEHDDQLIAALRSALDRLPPEDSALRCRCLAALAAELYYVEGLEVRRALCDEALAMAHRLGDPDLLVVVLLAVATALQVPGTEDERCALAAEALEVALSRGDLLAEAGARTSLSIYYGEAGRPQDMWDQVGPARALAERARLGFPLLVLESLVVAWHLMADDDEAASAAHSRFLEVAGRIAHPQEVEVVAGLTLAFALWQGTPMPGEVVAAMEHGPLPAQATLAYGLARGTGEDAGVAWLREHPVDLDHHDWFSRLEWCFAGAMAALTGDAELGAQAYGLLVPHAGRTCVAGTGAASGPVDAYLALAALAAGERETASRHADDAARLAQAWGLPRVLRWLDAARVRWSF